MEKISTMGKVPAETKKQFSKLIDTYEKLIFSICYKITGDYFAAEDLAQDTFLAAFQKYDSFDGNNEKAWICRIATNKSIDFMRSSSRRGMPAEDSFFELVPDEKESPEALCMEKEIKRNLEKLCMSLKAPYNEIAKEYYLKEMTVAEIARKRNLNVKTVQTRIYRARDMLRKIYEKEESR